VLKALTTRSAEMSLKPHLERRYHINVRDWGLEGAGSNLRGVWTMIPFKEILDTIMAMIHDYVAVAQECAR